METIQMGKPWPKVVKTAVLALVCLVVHAMPVPAQDHPVDEYVNRVMAKQDIPGMSVAVLEGGKILMARGYGYASLELRAPATAQTLYGLGSISKQFAATSVMLLVKDGTVDLDQPIGRYVAGLPETWAEVTVRHLLTHTSGIKEEVWEGGFIEFDRHEHGQLEVLETAFGPLEFAPGERWAYRNSAYRLLGMLIEEVSGESVWEFQRRRIFEPAGMNSTRNSDPKTIIPHRARGYGRDAYGPGGGPLVNRDPVAASAALTEGALISSVLDLARWDVALRTEKVLPRELLDEMWPVLAPYLAAQQKSLAALGAPGPLELVERRCEGSNRVFRYRVSMGGTNFLVAFAFDADNKVAQPVSFEEEY
jgi:CubicO group peptidase (beta-lactamase class C family)